MIRSLFIENFKGIGHGTTINIRPLTVFIGANSAGKSTCIHAIAALSQTTKLPNSGQAICLDDENASVHLGRFIEVSHSKSYSDPISIGIKLDLRQKGSRQKPRARQPTDVSATYEFKSTLRTQSITLNRATLSASGSNIIARPNRGDGNSFHLTTQAGQRFNIPLSRVRGFHLDLRTPFSTKLTNEIDTALKFINYQQLIEDALQSTYYLGPFRQAPLRRYPTRGSAPIEVGPFGEATAAMLANESIRSHSRANITRIAEWLARIELGKSIHVSRVGKSDLFEIALTLADGQRLPLADLGFGVSQVLPVLCQCSFSPVGATLLFEQPELHLHSLAARELAAILAETATSGKTVIFETHSPDMVHQIQRELRDGAITLNDVAIYRVDRVSGSTILKEIEIQDDDFDIYGGWEDGISLPRY